MTKPLIGMSGRRWPASALANNVPKAMYDLKFDLHFSDYPASVAAAGGLPVELTRDADVEGVLARLDGLILSGGADVEPDRYGHHADENLGAIEPDRDEWELALFREARRLEMPVLAICRGAQLANVYYGGTLNQHVELDDGAGHPQWDTDGHERTHEVNVVPGSLLSSLYPGHDRRQFAAPPDAGDARQRPRRVGHGVRRRRRGRRTPRSRRPGGAVAPGTARQTRPDLPLARRAKQRLLSPQALA